MYKKSISNWHEGLLSSHPDLATALTTEGLVDTIRSAVIVDHNGRQHLEVYPSKRLNPKEAKRFNERLDHAVGDKIELAVIPTARELDSLGIPNQPQM